jgi:hypothetical protein
MKTYTIRKGKHYSQPRLFKVRFKNGSVSYRISFDQSCRYDTGPEQGDISKLFGIGYLWSHHKDSARFGWTYNKDSGKIDIYTYCYVSGKRVSELIYSCSFDRSYDFTITPEFGKYIFKVKGITEVVREVPHFHEKKINYLLGFYFGGNVPSPGYMKIYMKEL